MKKSFKYLLLTGGLFIFASCAPMEPSKTELGPVSNFDAVEFEAVASADPATPFRVYLQAKSPGVVPIWDIDGKTVGGVYKFDAPVAGTYTFNAIGIYNQGGVDMGTTPKSVTFTVELGLADVYLTNAPWVWDRETQGHWGNGPNGSTGPEWDNAAPNSRPAEQYDDVMYFNKDGSFVLETQGEVVANEEPLKAGLFGDEWLGATTSTVIPYTMPADANWGWSLADNHISFSGGAFPSYIPSDSYVTDKYEILELTDKILYIRVMYPDWGGWYMRFTHPEEE